MEHDGTFPKIWKKFKFFPKIIKTWVIKNIDHISINSGNYAAAYYQTLEKVPRVLLPNKNSET